MRILLIALMILCSFSNGYGEQRVAVMGDSLAVHLADFMGADNYAYPGATTEMLVDVANRERFDSYSRIYIYVGINDVYSDWSRARTINNYSAILDIIKSKSRASIVINSVLPTMNLVRNEQVQGVNRALQILASDKGCKYVDLWSVFLNPYTGTLKLNYDEVHLNEAGYSLWSQYLLMVR